jgi:CBS-domain-containing membrane protein
MHARDVMSGEVMSIAATATVHEACELLVNARVSAMPVVDDDGVMIGIVSEADLLACVEEGERAARPGSAPGPADGSAKAAADAAARSRRVVDVMTKDVVSVDENASLAEVSALMRKHHVKRVPVLREHAVVGIVSRIDLLRASISFGPLPDMTSASEAARAADERMRRDVAAAVAGHSWSVAERVDIVVDNGVVHLWGVVPSEEVRAAYREAAEGVLGLKALKVHMHVARSPGRPGPLPDLEQDR